MSKHHIIALAGNPNVGKTTLFNTLTGSRQTVGNWPGVTVEHKSGYYTHKGQKVEVIDLPGIYSLNGGSPDEEVARDFILNQKPDLVINIVDASNLERNLYLSVQLLELKVPMMMVLSMLDIAQRNEAELDIPHLQSHVGYEVIALDLASKAGQQRLLDSIESSLHSSPIPIEVHYDEIVEMQLPLIAELIEGCELASSVSSRWHALKLIEEDKFEWAKIPEDCKERILPLIKAISKHRGQPAPAVIADDRYGFVRGLIKDVVKRKRRTPFTFSDRIDQVVLSGIWGLPIFFFVMFLVFLFAVHLSQPIVGLIHTSLTWLLVEQLGNLLSWLSLPSWLSVFITQGLGGGITTIGTFIPPIFFIYVSLSILEDSGYMARAAFIADKFMRLIGLPGKAFIPLLVGFGCTVTAIMATRTLENKRDRLLASLLSPFMSCGGKLPVYTFLAMMFFPRHAALLVFGLYFGGVVMAMVTGLLLKKTLFKSEPGHFVMELPPYHVPTFNGIFLHTWFRLKDFVFRAGKTILLVIVFINILQLVYIPSPFTAKGEAPQKETILQVGGKLITPLLRPMGIKKDNWQASVALISGLFAKEAIVGTIQSLYQPDNEADKLQNVVQRRFGSLNAILAYLFFVMLYSPCAASLTMLWREHGVGWTLFSFVYLTVLAWMIATLIFQLSSWNAQSPLWIGVIALLVLSFYLILKIIGKKDKHALIT